MRPVAGPSRKAQVLREQHQENGADTLLWVALLGVPRLEWRSRALAISRRQARAVLYRLAYEARPVGREDLADMVWPETEPTIARRNLVRVLSQLRAELPDKLLVKSDNTAVWLDVDRFASDVGRFQQLNAALTLDKWRTAVELYRGPFLHGFTLTGSHVFDAWQRDAASILEQQYLDLLERLLEQARTAGNSAQAIDFANRYLAVDELAERIHCALITIYLAAGKRTAALQQYSSCAEILHRELGVEPLPETRAVFEAARDGTPFRPTPRAAPPGWSTLPGLDLPLTGRDDAWSELMQTFAQRLSGGAILISGAPGVGKSRLMQEFASAQTSLVLAGNCSTGSTAFSYQPLLQALRQALVHDSDGDLLEPIWLAELALLMPELRKRYPDLPAPLTLSPEQAQVRLLEAFTRAFRSLAENSGLLLCLDDLHAADEGTLAWLQYVASRMTGSRICLLVTFREEDARRLAEWDRALSRAGISSHIQLPALSAESVGALLTLVGSSKDAAAALAPLLHEATGGNAYFLLETLRELLEQGGLEQPPSGVPLPATVREAVLRRTARLAPLARQVLEIAAVLSPLLELPLLAAASGRSELEIAGALDELVARQVVAAENGRFRFAHDLSREAVYGNISDWRRRLLHRRVADGLEQLPDSSRDTLVGELARHYEKSGALELAVERYVEAGELARRVYAHQVAIKLLRRATALLPDLPHTGQARAAQLNESLGDLLTIVGDQEAARHALQQSLAALGGDQALGRARVYFRIGRSWSAQQELDAADEALQLASELLQTADDPQTEAWQSLWLDIKLAQANVLYLQNRLRRLAALCEKLHEPVRVHGTLTQQADFYSTLAMLNNRQLRFAPSEESMAYAQQALLIAQQLSDQHLIAWKTFNVGFQLLWFGNLAEALHMISRAYAKAEEIGDLSLQNRAITYLTISYRFLGEETQVRNCVARAAASTKEEGSQFYVGAAAANGAWLAYRSSNWDEADELAHAAIAHWRDGAYPFRWLAYFPLLAMALENGGLETAAALAGKLLAPEQQRLPDPIASLLETAVQTWEAPHSRSRTRRALQEVVILAKEHGYL